MFILLNTNFLNTPRELAQARELKQYEIQYELLNKKLAQIEEVLHNIEDRDNNLYRLYFEEIQFLKNNEKQVLEVLTDVNPSKATTIPR